MSVDVDQLRVGLEAMDGSAHDALVVILRIRGELQKMVANAQLLLQKENIASGALDNWSGIIHGFDNRLEPLHREAMASKTPDGSEPFSQWGDLKAIAVQVGQASNQLADQLDESWLSRLLGSPVGLLGAAVGGYLAWRYVVAPMLNRKGSV